MGASLLAVADTGSFSAAADALFLSQPVISKQVQKLEHQLGVRLFDRAHRRAELTDAGRRAYPPAQALARQYQLLEQAVHPDGSLRLALLPRRGLLRLSSNAGGLFRRVSPHAAHGGGTGKYRHARAHPERAL